MERPETIGEAARGRVEVVAITDHDEIRGALRARDWAHEHPELGVDVVVGDEALAALNTDYRTKRTDDVGMVAPRLVEMPPGSFHRDGCARSLASCGPLSSLSAVSSKARPAAPPPVRGA